MLKMDISAYYNEIEPEENITEEEKKYLKSLKEKDVTKIAYLKLLDTFDLIDERYNI